MKFALKPSLIAIALCSTLTATAADKTSLMTVYQQALENDTQVKVSEAGLKATEQSVRISRSSLLPQITAGVSLTRRDTDNEGQGLDGSPTEPYNNINDQTSFQVRLNQSIFDWSQWVALDQANIRLQAAELNHASSLQTLITRVAQAYFNVLSAEENLAITLAEKTANQQQLDLTREQYESGLANATDYLDAQANFEQSAAGEINARNNLDTTKEALREITGQYYMALEGIDDSIAMEQPAPANIDDWMRVARDSNLSLKAQQMNLRVAREDVKRNRSGHYPTADLSVTYTDSDTDTERNFPVSNIDQTSQSASDGYSATLSVSVPVFSGFRTSAQTEQANYNFQRSAHELEQRDRTVQKNTRNAYTALQASILSYNANQRVLESSQRSLESTREGYQAGTRTINDVLRSTRSVYNAQRSLVTAKYNYLINSLRLKESVGTLTESDLQRVDSILKQF